MSTTDKKPRNMTIKGFLNKASGKASASAIGFIQQYREYMLTGELADITAPILSKVDSQEILPTPALDEIRSAVLAHLIVSEAKKAADKLAKQQEKFAQSFSTIDETDEDEAQSASKPWIARVLNGRGELLTRINSKGKEVDLQQSFDKASVCARWLDRRLFDHTSDCHGVIEYAGSVQLERVERSDAIARLLKPAAQPMSRKTASDGKLSWGVKSKPSHSHFSHG